jgi:altronate dehydratase small subunit
MTDGPAAAGEAPLAFDALVVHPADDVAVALRDLAEDETVRIRCGSATTTLRVLDAVPLGHKFALRPIAAGSPVRKYGEAIGAATQAIDAGRHVHVHNMHSQRARRTS